MMKSTKAKINKILRGFQVQAMIIQAILMKRNMKLCQYRTRLEIKNNINIYKYILINWKIFNTTTKYQIINLM